MASATDETLDTSRRSTRYKPSPLNAPSVRVRLLTGQVYPVKIDEPFESFTEYAVDALRNRKQWRGVASARAKMRDVCRDYLKESLKLDADEQLREIAAAGLIEVEIPNTCGEAAFDFPWEFAISEATALLRTPEAPEAPLIVRRLRRGQTGPRHDMDDMTGLVVQSAPANLSAFYTFDSEQKLVTSSLPEITIANAIGLTAAQLKSRIEDESPHFIHFAGIDGLQGSALLKWPEEKHERGMFFPDENGTAVIVPPKVVAQAATAGTNGRPALVSYNFYYSSWPLASVTVAKGAAAAIGFQDNIDDSAAELFFALFYEKWRSSKWDLLAAYRSAWQGLQATNINLLGTGIVLWSAHSLFPTPVPGTGKGNRATGTGNGAPPSATGSGTPLPGTGTGGPEPIRHAAEFEDLPDAVNVTIVPLKNLNYSMLHNNSPVFERFQITRQSSGRLLNVAVHLSLQTGSEIATYSTAFNLGPELPLVDVNKLARVSLTSEMARSLRESVYTSLFVSVKWEDKLVFQETFRIALLPPYEWRDDDSNRKWLPSFVLPRDPMIAKLIDSAQRFLTAVADDSGAGFDGYQGVGVEGKIEDRCESVDRQVYSLWWSLIQDYGLSYVNPPPTFTIKSQRLRTPADIIAGHRGTCIDLTLLLAALLEYIDVHPVIFLLKGHAFPGYWRSEESSALLSQETLSRPHSHSAPTSQAPWMFDRICYSDLLQLVREGHLIPLESVALTQRCGYWDAVSQGVENLRSREEFEFLIDIRTAREFNVTPIPLWESHL